VKHLWTDTSTLLDISSFSSWVSSSGEPFRNALRSDHARLVALSKSNLHSVFWHGLEVVDQVDSTIVANETINFFPPHFLHKFESRNGRVFARFIGARSTTTQVHAVPLVQSWVSLRTMIENDWFPLGRISVFYALQLVQEERRRLARRQRSVVTSLQDVLAQQHCEENDESEQPDVSLITNAIADASAARKQSLAPLAEPSLQPLAEPLAPLAPLEPLAPPPPDVLTLFRDKTISKRWFDVPAIAIVDYLTCHSLLKHVGHATSTFYQGFHHCIVIQNHLMVDDVFDDLRDILADQRSGLNRQIYKHFQTRDRLNQHVPNVIRRLVEVARSGWEVASAFDQTSQKINFDEICFRETCAKKELELVLANEASQAIVFLLSNLCSRVVAHLDQNWALPRGVEWTVVRPRLPKA
jgi:hypothetical protein